MHIQNPQRQIHRQTHLNRKINANYYYDGDFLTVEHCLQSLGAKGAIHRTQEDDETDESFDEAALDRAAFEAVEPNVSKAHGDEEESH